MGPVGIMTCLDDTELRQKRIFYFNFWLSLKFNRSITQNYSFENSALNRDVANLWIDLRHQKCAKMLNRNWDLFVLKKLKSLIQHYFTVMNRCFKSRMWEQKMYSPIIQILRDLCHELIQEPEWRQMKIKLNWPGRHSTSCLRPVGLVWLKQTCTNCWSQHHESHDKFHHLPFNQFL